MSVPEAEKNIKNVVERDEKYEKKANEIYNKIEKLESSMENRENKKIIEDDLFDEDNYFDEDECYDEEDYLNDDYDEDDFFEDIEKMNQMMELKEREELKEALAQVKKQIKDKVEKNKTFEQYLKEKTKEELIAITAMYYRKNEGKEVKEDIKSILQNRKELFKASIEVSTTAQIEKLKKLLEKGYKEITIKKVQDLDEFTDEYFPTRMFGILFVKIQGKKIILHIPRENIEILKEILNDKEVIKINTEFNQAYSFIRGVINTYGVIETGKLGELYEKCFNKSSEGLPEKIVLYIMNYQETGIYIDKKNKEKTYLYHGILKEKEAEQIIKNTEKLDYCEYSIDKYLKLSKESEYIKQTKSYQKMKNTLKQKELWKIDDVRTIPDEIIPQYADLNRIKAAKKDAEELLDMVCMSFDMLDPFSDELGKTMRKFIIAISKELPDWNKKGKI